MELLARVKGRQADEGRWMEEWREQCATAPHSWDITMDKVTSMRHTINFMELHSIKKVIDLFYLAKGCCLLAYKAQLLHCDHTGYF